MQNQIYIILQVPESNFQLFLFFFLHTQILRVRKFYNRYTEVS